jgi:hypothetical protein
MTSQTEGLLKFTDYRIICLTSCLEFERQDKSQSTESDYELMDLKNTFDHTAEHKGWRQ